MLASHFDAHSTCEKWIRLDMGGARWVCNAKRLMFRTTVVVVVVVVVVVFVVVVILLRCVSTRLHGASEAY